MWRVLPRRVVAGWDRMAIPCRAVTGQCGVWDRWRLIPFRAVTGQVGARFTIGQGGMGGRLCIPPAPAPRATLFPLLICDFCLKPSVYSLVFVLLHSFYPAFTCGKTTFHLWEICRIVNIFSGASYAFCGDITMFWPAKKEKYYKNRQILPISIDMSIFRLYT